jgi:hypothetical protein
MAGHNCGFFPNILFNRVDLLSLQNVQTKHWAFYCCGSKFRFFLRPAPVCLEQGLGHRNVAQTSLTGYPPLKGRKFRYEFFSSGVGT